HDSTEGKTELFWDYVDSSLSNTRTELIDAVKGTSQSSDPKVFNLEVGALVHSFLDIKLKDDYNLYGTPSIVALTIAPSRSAGVAQTPANGGLRTSASSSKSKTRNSGSGTRGTDRQEAKSRDSTRLSIGVWGPPLGGPYFTLPVRVSASGSRVGQRSRKVAHDESAVERGICRTFPGSAPLLAIAAVFLKVQDAGSNAEILSKSHPQRHCEALRSKGGVASAGSYFTLGTRCRLFGNRLPLGLLYVDDQRTMRRIIKITEDTHTRRQEVLQTPLVDHWGPVRTATSPLKNELIPNLMLYNF
ncbi:hypothetical protein SCHPADRAFT_897454, partial [Schizopora paradoxa]